MWAWLAALATAPLLLDSMQLVIEQYVMSDVLFQALLLAAGLLVELFLVSWLAGALDPVSRTVPTCLGRCW